MTVLQPKGQDGWTEDAHECNQALADEYHGVDVSISQARFFGFRGGFFVVTFV